MSSSRLAVVALLFTVPGFAWAETAARPQRVLEVVSVKVERLNEGGDKTHRITAMGKVRSAGWTMPALRAIRERHPNNAVAGFEMVAVPPRRPAAQMLGEVTATIETTIGAIQHTLVVRGARKSVECTLAGEVSCE